ncbi:MAG: hypothetical protein ACI89U_001801 [Gammaproteobacteria bacterium]|jgi:hypothetical protein
MTSLKMSVQKLVFASEARQSDGAECSSYLHWSGPQEIAALTLAMTSLKMSVQKLVFASEARQSDGAECSSYLYWSCLQEIAELLLATTPLKNAHFLMGTS